MDKMDKEEYLSPQSLAVPSVRLRRYSQDLIPFDKSVAAAESDQRSSTKPATQETLNVIFFQVFIPLLIAGLILLVQGFYWMKFSTGRLLSTSQSSSFWSLLSSDSRGVLK